MSAAGRSGVDRIDDGTAAMPGDGSGSSAAAPPSAWRDPVTWVVAVLVLAGYFFIALSRLLRLDPASYDLAIFTEYVKQMSHLHWPVVDVLKPGFNELGDHFQIAVGVLAPFFRVIPSPATLLFFQALACAISVFPVVSAGFALTGRATGRLIGFGYGFSWGLQQLNFFDFHEVALAVPLLAFSLSALVRRRPAAAIGWAVPLVFVKEDQGFTVAAIGLLLAAAAAFPGLLPGPPGAGQPGAGGRAEQGALSFRGRLASSRTALLGGLFLVGWGLFWSWFAISVIIPHFNPGHVYGFWKNGGVVGGGQHFSVTALAAQTAHDWPVKAETVGLLLLATAFTALGSPVALLAVPILALRFVSTYPVYWGDGWHYNATLMPVLFIAATDAIGRWGRSRDRAPLAAGQPLAGLAGNAFFRNGGALIAGATVALAIHFPLSGLWRASTYQLDNAHIAAANAAMAVVPDGATVQTTLDLLAPLAARTDTFWIGTPHNPVTQYVVFDEDDNGYTAPISDVPAFIAMLYPHDGYVQVFERDDVYVFRRG